MAARMLSSDPDHAIEPDVLALTYEINDAGVGQSAWSCEGHADANGVLCRVPAVWFYASNIVHVELLADHVQQLETSRQLTHRWRITPLLHGRLELDCPTFALAPLIELSPNAGAPRHTTKPVGVLAELRTDLRRLALSLGNRIRIQAERELDALRRELG